MEMYLGMMDAVLFAKLKRDGNAYTIAVFKQMSAMRYVEMG